MNSATAIAEYGLQAGKRKSASPAKIKFAALLIRLWNRPSGEADHLSDWWEQGFLTLRMFLPKQDASCTGSDRVYVPSAAAFLDGLANTAGERGVALENLSAQATQLTEYSGSSEAKKAKIPWIALENISYLEAKPFPALAHMTEASIDSDMLQPLTQEELLLELHESPQWLNFVSSPAQDEFGQLDETALRQSAQPEDLFALRSQPSQPHEPEGSLLFPVWYGTNRKKAERADSMASYSDSRDDANALHLGRCIVRIPADVPFGTVGSPWWHRLYSATARNRRMRVSEVEVYDDPTFLANLRRALSETDDKSVLLYIHGYNTKFESAVIRAAQIGRDLDVRGQMALFSWPSTGNKRGYISDQNRADASEASLEKFVRLLAMRVGAARLNVIAHSMGNRVFARVASRLESYTKNTKVELGIVILAAPDVDRDTFMNLASAFPLLSNNTTMYVSSKDRALQLSGYLQSFERAGHTPPVTIHPGIHTIQVGDLDMSFLGLGHDYYARTEPVLYDMASLLQGNTDPNLRTRLKKVVGQGVQGVVGIGEAHDHWQIRR